MGQPHGKPTTSAGLCSTSIASPRWRGRGRGSFRRPTCRSPRDSERCSPSRRIHIRSFHHSSATDPARNGRGAAVANELVLIVEDNPQSLKLVRDILQIKGYQTIEAETGEEGVRLARERHPALILMDIQLPGINGIEALQRLRADPVTSPIPVIAVTASVMTQDRARIMAAGFNGFQSKPISVNQLLATVREALDKP